ncbi:aminopeptidase P family protein, partial [Salmonella enterica subsp. enterica serovar Newport]|nr:aminopeptidase P family protein [Salmonella enterica subsp. enterica serovar Newport]
MTTGVGGSTIEAELAKLSSQRDSVAPIGQAERDERVARAQKLMRDNGLRALYLDSSTSTFYFTGLRYGRSERMHAAILPAEGQLVHISPTFELEKLQAMLGRDEPVRTWEEHESPTELVIEMLRGMGIESGEIGVDPMTPFFTFDGLRR